MLYWIASRNLMRWYTLNKRRSLFSFFVIALTTLLRALSLAFLSIQAVMKRQKLAIPLLEHLSPLPLQVLDMCSLEKEAVMNGGEILEEKATRAIYYLLTRQLVSCLKNQKARLIFQHLSCSVFPQQI